MSKDKEAKGRRLEGRGASGGKGVGVDKEKRQLSVPGLVIALVAVLALSVVFMGAIAGWFDDPKVVLDAEYACEGGCEMVDLAGAEYEELVDEGKSFVVFVDQGGCTTADRLRGYVEDWAAEAGVRVYRMMFTEARETSLHEFVKYYPSFVVVSRGRVVGYLRADSDEDADAYNDEGAFYEWVGKWL